jgi:hypothetical protein
VLLSGSDAQPPSASRHTHATQTGTVIASRIVIIFLALSGIRAVHVQPTFALAMRECRLQ